jgi:hypothetical protein
MKHRKKIKHEPHLIYKKNLFHIFWLVSVFSVIYIFIENPENDNNLDLKVSEYQNDTFRLSASQTTSRIPASNNVSPIERFPKRTAAKNRENAIDSREQKNERKFTIKTKISEEVTLSNGMKVQIVSYVEEINNNDLETNDKAVELETTQAQGINFWLNAFSYNKKAQAAAIYCQNHKDLKLEDHAKYLGYFSQTISPTQFNEIVQCLDLRMNETQSVTFMSVFLEYSGISGFKNLGSLMCENTTTWDDRLYSNTLSTYMFQYNQIEKYFLYNFLNCPLPTDKSTNFWQPIGCTNSNRLVNTANYICDIFEVE